MKQINPQRQREFAIDVVRQLRDHKYQAYWAGGCARDHLLNRLPKDYDVATSAHPEEICAVFRHRKTLAIGAAFGVITVVGPRDAGQVEVTTFRHDVSYSDGRHPDKITFSSAEEDAKRRDFTINGMFFDPLGEWIIDFVGGEADLSAGVVRAIGDAHARFTEDKLRMLRAVRFASILNFQLEESTQAAIRQMAAEVTVVSAERIAGEMRLMLVHPARARAVELLLSTGLLRAILPEVDQYSKSAEWKQSLAMLDALEQPSFALSLAALLSVSPENLAETIGSRWRLARKEIDCAAWLLSRRNSLAGAATQRWSKLQPLLAGEWADELVQFHEAQAKLGMIKNDDVAFCHERMRLPKAELDSPPLVSGNDLIALGIPRGPVFAKMLQAVRDAQLDGELRDRVAAIEWVAQLWKERSA